MSDAQRYIQRQRENRKFERYLHRVGRLMPALATRVFALRKTGYMGCGFHWGMERSLGRLIASVNDFENADLWRGKEAFATRTIIQVCARALFEDVAAAERSLDPSIRITRDLRAAIRRNSGDKFPPETLPQSAASGGDTLTPGDATS